MADLMEAITALAKRRGIVFPSSEIYGGLRSSWDYGPLGVEMKRNIKNAWWRSMVQLRDDVVGLDAAIIMSPKVWEASGHLEVFTDPWSSASTAISGSAPTTCRASTRLSRVTRRTRRRSTWSTGRAARTAAIVSSPTPATST